MPNKDVKIDGMNIWRNVFSIKIYTEIKPD